MTTDYYGTKSPGHLWYAWQYVKVFTTTPFRAATRPDVWAAGKNTTLSLATLIGTKFAVPYVIMLPLLPTVLWIGGICTGLYFAKRTYNALSALKGSGTVRDFIRQRKEKWTKKKSLGTRLKARLAKAGMLMGYVVAAAGAIIGVHAALQYAGIALPGFAASGTAMGAFLATIALPVVIGAGAAVALVGISAGILCKKKANKLLGITAPEKKSKAPDSTGTLGTQAVAPSFGNAAAAPKTVLTEAQIRNAEMRAAALKNLGK